MRPLPLVLALSLSFGVAVAQTSGSTGTGSSMTGEQAAPAAQPGTGTRNAETKKDDTLARGDRKFIQEAAESGMFEVQAAQMGATKATDPNVKSFASMLVDHHTAANNELVQLTLPTLREHLAQAQKLPQAGKGGAAAMGNRGTEKPGG